MTLDKEEHRTLLLQLVNQTAFPGQFAEEIVALKTALEAAGVAGDDAVDKELATPGVSCRL